MNSTSLEALQPELDNFIRHALHEDVKEGDHSSIACIPADKPGKARLLVKENAVLAGVDLAEHIFAFAAPEIRFEKFVSDGAKVEKGTIVFVVEGPIRKILMLERLMLNCMQRMSGIATKTKRMTDILSAYHTRLLDTRKTTPGIRFLEKWAVRIGGGHNHRFGLYDMIMLKDNHIDGAGGIEKAVKAVHQYLAEKQLDLKIEVETRNLEEVKQAMAVGGIHRIMLDNFTPELITEALKLIDGKYETEASGGITEANIASFAATGVDYVSSSEMTHSVKSIDLSLKLF